ncbi:iron-containing alcohol dehydrogenase [Candidatus Enterococcus ferrettii]|uniref:Lactaldehyde reductase n=1 Tax=Candidatus Enterococcus ferrettii TaxID=2815324 RepID=A0ABV0EVL2_9ENTE|nr:iron-containing alcohol dehydrogenase [Enterococcus sp. 665A]MBO1342333.1 iron-containing alcohol dehydrogenase [Enterococcus sp. 665A]
MAEHVFYVPATNIMGRGCINNIGEHIKPLGFKKALLVTDKFLSSSDILPKVTKPLDEIGVEYLIFDNVKANPTVASVEEGLTLLEENNCDFIISLGGGSPQDAASGIAILATNGGKMQDYEGMHKTTEKALPVVAINTTAGTSAEITINYVITDEDRGVKMIMIDRNSLALMSVNDPELMVDKPADLTAATGIDALTHSIEALVTPGAFPVTNVVAEAAVKLIFDNLPTAVKEGHNLDARENMVYAIFLAGMAFNNAGLGYVHAMAHQLGGLYDLPHGVCNAMLLPIVERENAKVVPERFRRIAEVIGLDTAGKSDQACAGYVIEQIKVLSKKVGIPEKLSELGVHEVDLQKLAENAQLDACAGANPYLPTVEETIEMFKEIL